MPHAAACRPTAPYARALRVGTSALACLGLVACHASFEDFRDEPPGALDASDTSLPDAATDAPVDASVDAAPDPDGGTELVASGTFEGRAGYRAEGTVRLERTPAGLILRFDGSFSSQSVPGPVVVLSERDALQGGLDASLGDVELAVLQSREGSQQYAVPEEAVGARYAWIYCRPFRV